VSTRANASKNGSNSSNESQHNETKHVRHEHVSPCNESAWPDKAEGLVCDDCKVPVNKFSYFYETCDNYCSIQGRKCMGGWKNEDSTCDEKEPIMCNEAVMSDVAICKCGVRVNETLRSVFKEQAANKVNSSCGKSEEDTDFWTDKGLFEAAGVETQEKCRALCANQHGCGAWSWGSQQNVPGLTNMCFLKQVIWGHAITKHSKQGVTSGYPYTDCQMFEPSYYYNPSHHVKHHAKAKGHKEHEEWRDNFTQKDGDRLQGVIRAKHGFCLDTAEPHKNGSQVQMMTCKPGSDSQAWQWEKTTGQIKNKLGLCLSTDTFNELSVLRAVECDCALDNCWNQQFSFAADKGTFKNWRGPCLDAGERNRDGGSVYLRSCNSDNWNQQFEMGALEDMDVPKVEPIPHPTLYCFALMLPHSYEQGLLAMQFQAEVSLFACEAYSVFSNAAIEVTHGLTSHIVDSDLKCDKGGEFGTALNLNIFIAVWKKVVEDAVFLEHDWTVKVDPDAVFFPQRLRGIVAMHPETDKGVYLNNCKFGLHGPIEVFSRHAVTTWSTGHKQCIDHFWKLCHGDCLWGEDLFIDQCLAKVLGAQRENDYRILTEDHCDPPKDWDSCTDESRVAFHPFKNETGYRTCLNNAEKARGGNANKYPEPPAPTTEKPHPTTAAPTTEAPTTEKPHPTTAAPTTEAPTTAAPTTAAPTTAAPTTAAPTTEKPHTTEAAHATEKPRTTEPASDTAEKLQAT